jgi:tetrahydromethanopterin S-methyltransferase subunit F
MASSFNWTTVLERIIAGVIAGIIAGTVTAIILMHFTHVVK